jgi:hypothetical protein
VIDTTISLLDDVDLTGTAPRTAHIMGDSMPVTSWAQVLDILVEHLYDTFDNFIATIQSDEFVSKFFSPDSSSFSSSAEIHDTGYYVDTGISTNRKQKLVTEIAQLFNLTRTDILVDLSEPLEEKSV